MNGPAAPAAVEVTVPAGAPSPRRPERLKKRAAFVAVAKGIRISRGPFTLQALRRSCDARIGSLPRIGFTVTKKVGNAVVRNRIRRRLRALADALAGEFQSSTDYVIVARLEALDAPFEGLGRELSAALCAAGRKLDRPLSAPRSARAERP